MVLLQVNQSDTYKFTLGHSLWFQITVSLSPSQYIIQNTCFPQEMVSRQDPCGHLTKWSVLNLQSCIAGGKKKVSQSQEVFRF